MRKFVLRNALGEAKDLTEIGSFLTNPKGLGKDRIASYVQIGNRYVVNDNKRKQSSINGKITFESYEGYKDFCRFVMREPIILEYTAAGTYMMQVQIEKLGKTEMDNMGLTVDITMKGLTAWYKTMRYENLSSENGKMYSHTYPYVYTDDAAGNIEYDVDSTEENPVKLTVFGPCTNPAWTLYINGVKTVDGKILCRIPEGNRLIVDTTNIPYEIAEYDASGEFVRDLYQYSDFATKRFLYSQFGTNKITFTHEGSEEIRVAAEVRIEYDSV